MNIDVFPSVAHGEIKAIASKSAAHRLLICAAFADKKTTLICTETNKDIEATVRCLCALGADIKRIGTKYEISPIAAESIIKGSLLHVGESGSTLRFLLPIAAMLGSNSAFVLEGRLPQRPLSPLAEELEAHGVTIKREGNTISLCGQLAGNRFSIDGGVSSQFVSGLLFALALSHKEATLEITGKLESAPYIAITESALEAFGISFSKENGRIYKLNGFQALTSPSLLTVEGDWSNAAFPLAMGAISGKVRVYGLSMHSKQGDMEILSLLGRFGAKVEADHDSVTVSPAPLCGISIDAKSIPDLVPVLAVVASFADGKTEISGVSRLRIKESDRIESTCQMLRALGGKIEATDDRLVIYGASHLRGGTVSSYSDHRIAMSAAVAALRCSSPVTVTGAEATEKSYPSFWDDIERLSVEYCKAAN